MGNRIKELRKARNMTQEALGKLVGATSNQIKYWESGHVDLIEAAKIADVFDVSLEYLAGATDINDRAIRRNLDRAYDRLNEEGRLKIAYYALDLSEIVRYRNTEGGEEDAQATR